MHRSHAEPRRREHTSGIESGTRAEPIGLDSNGDRSSGRGVRYGLGLLLLALGAGLAAALILTVGAAHADVLLMGVNAGF